MKLRNLAKSLMAVALALAVVVTPMSAVKAAEPQEQQFVLDYNQLATWISGGFVGMTANGEAVIMALDAESDYGIIIFCDNTDMTAASFVGPIAYNGNAMTIADESNGLALTIAVSDLGNGALAFDMGDLGVVAVSAQPQEVVSELVRMAITGYTHVA